MPSGKHIIEEDIQRFELNGFGTQKLRIAVCRPKPLDEMMARAAALPSMTEAPPAPEKAEIPEPAPTRGSAPSRLSRPDPSPMRGFRRASTRWQRSAA